MAAMQDELGPECVTGVVSVTVTDGNSDVQFEAFQVVYKVQLLDGSQQCFCSALLCITIPCQNFPSHLLV